MRRTIKTDDGDAVLNASDHRVKDGIQAIVIQKMLSTRASRLHQDR